MWLPVGARRGVKALEPNRNEVCVLVALFGSSILGWERSHSLSLMALCLAITCEKGKAKRDRLNIYLRELYKRIKTTITYHATAFMRKAQVISSMQETYHSTVSSVFCFLGGGISSSLSISSSSSSIASSIPSSSVPSS